MNIMTKILSTVTGVLLTAGPVFATTMNQIPEPGVLGLLAAGGVIGVIITIRKRRK